MKGQRDYLYYEELNRHSYNRRCIDGHVTGSGKCMGYCEFSGHSGYLTEKLRKKHDCLVKNCDYYLPKIKIKHTESESAKQKAQNVIFEIVDGYEGMKAQKIVSDENGGILVKYITITKAYLISEIEEKLSFIMNMPVKMEKVECDFERAAKIILG